jgi:hypothetical protein
VEFLARYFAPNPVLLVEEIRLGLSLLAKGKVNLNPPKMASRKAMAAMFRKAEEIEGRP